MTRDEIAEIFKQERTMNFDVTYNGPLDTVEWNDDPKVDAANLIAACRAIVGAAAHRPAGATPTRALLSDLRAAITQFDLNPRVR